MNFGKNNLHLAISPYLLQHKSNPIWWQEWKKEVIEYALRTEKPIFLSIGYSSCHWCHVMADESFKDLKIAKILNDNFVCIKVDREERPDIDEYFMDFIVSLKGQGGWPLNVFLTSDLRPFYAMNYLQPKKTGNFPGFTQVIRLVLDYYKKNEEKIEYFYPSDLSHGKFEQKSIIDAFLANYDQYYGGFGEGAKFPPHTPLLFMLYYYTSIKNEKLQQMIEKTLDLMIMKGLHDHLGGGFFRYCVDREWTIPHFEKMLYDQAMLLWIYSLAYKIFGKFSYMQACEGILKCLREKFESDSLYYASIDADANHREGLTYLWAVEEINDILTANEFKRFCQVYEIDRNFAGMIHLIKKNQEFLPLINSKLLRARNARPQPAIDKRIITSWNSLVGIAFMNAARFLDKEELTDKARQLYSRLIKLHYLEGKLFRSSVDGRLQKQEFLEDYSALLLLTTYLQEEIGEYSLTELYYKLKRFNVQGKWISSINTDFLRIPADAFDHPIPSSVSMAELALLRTDILKKRRFASGTFKQPGIFDFWNLSILVRNGHFHIFDSPYKLPYDRLPANIIQRKGTKLRDCYMGRCSE